MFENHSIFAFILGGTAFFLLGVSFVSENLQSLASNSVRNLLVRFTRKPIYGFISGILITFILQSSGAITSMLVGLGSARVITLKQVMGVIVGTAVGTSIIVQVLTFSIQSWGLPLFITAFFIYFLAQKPTLKKVFAVLMGIGLMYMGLEFVGMGSQNLKDVIFFKDFLSYLNTKPLLTVLVSFALTSLVHSSAIVVLFATFLASTQSISLYEAMFWVYGANVGTTTTALMASLNSNVVGRQIAWAHMLYKLASITLFFGFTDLFIQLFQQESAAHNVANANVAFNVISAVVLFPFMGLGVKVIKKLIKPSRKERKIQPKYIYRGNVTSSTIALAHAEREVLRMGDTVSKMIRRSIDFVMNDDEVLEKKLHAKDNKVDFLYEAVYNFLADFSKEGRLTDRMTRVLFFASDLESIADVVEKNIITLARKKHNLKVDFTPEGQKELLLIHEKVTNLMQLSLIYFQKEHEMKKDEILELKVEISNVERVFRENHLARFVKGRKDAIASSSIFMDILSEYRRISSLACHQLDLGSKKYEDVEDS